MGWLNSVRPILRPGATTVKPLREECHFRAGGGLIRTRLVGKSVQDDPTTRLPLDSSAGSASGYTYAREG